MTRTTLELAPISKFRHQCLPRPSLWTLNPMGVFSQVNAPFEATRVLFLDGPRVLNHGHHTSASQPGRNFDAPQTTVPIEWADRPWNRVSNLQPHCREAETLSRGCSGCRPQPV
ncbi:hypothetical protein AVEN_76682-1 [Araneus ventricosus]|uniref:Uncharacterized protein n=1 Tax=Araneus ventricosus TaxID=182803 RepID=A0A4Y2BPT9_ARAVE|nr:hypothetical protein AVEN_76682-1 [Araneus ventricosus]